MFLFSFDFGRVVLRTYRKCCRPKKKCFFSWQCVVGCHTLLLFCVTHARPCVRGGRGAGGGSDGGELGVRMENSIGRICTHDREITHHKCPRIRPFNHSITHAMENTSLCGLWPIRCITSAAPTCVGAMSWPWRASVQSGENTPRNGPGILVHSTNYTMYIHSVHCWVLSRHESRLHSLFLQ